MQIEVSVFQRNSIPTNLRSFQKLHTKTTLKQKNILLFIASFRKQFGETDLDDR